MDHDAETGNVSYNFQMYFRVGVEVQSTWSIVSSKLQQKVRDYKSKVTLLLLVCVRISCCCAGWMSFVCCFIKRFQYFYVF